MKKINRTKEFILGMLVIITIGFGWYFPYLGFIVPVVMISAVIVSLFMGRYHCGNFCPRAMFFNRFLSKFSYKKQIPAFFKSKITRGVFLVIMMSTLSYMISRDISSVEHWGFVFWRMCAVTTLIGIVLGVLFKPRTWCSFCPMGTMQNILGGKNSTLYISPDKCKSCKLCEKNCPLELSIVNKKEDKIINNRDCIRCSQCIISCPIKALDFDKKNCA